MYPPGSWQYVLTAPARLETDYHAVAPTLADSTVVHGRHWSVFFVSALTSNVEQFYDGVPDSGYSVDNLVPSAPSFLAAQPQGSGANRVVALHWGRVNDADVQYYAVFRDTAAGFTPSMSNRIGATTDTAFVDSLPLPAATYKVAAVDFSGNTGASATAYQALTGVTRPSVVLGLRLEGPNPARNRVAMRVDIPRRAQVQLEVFGPDGRRVRRLLGGDLEAGSRRVTWDVDGPPGHAVAPGLYFIRLETNGARLVRKVLVLR